MKGDEIWKDIVGYEGLYKISNFGRLKSLYKRKERILKPSDNGCGYLRINLVKDGKLTSKYIHRLVAEAFIDNPQNKPQVNHIDGCKYNNMWTNLEWNTAVENIQHAMENGLTHVKTKEVKVFLYETDELVGVYDSLSEACEELGADVRMASRVALHQRNHTHGYVFIYTEDENIVFTEDVYPSFEQLAFSI